MGRAAARSKSRRFWTRALLTTTVLFFVLLGLLTWDYSQTDLRSLRSQYETWVGREFERAVETTSAASMGFDDAPIAVEQALHGLELDVRGWTIRLWISSEPPPPGKWYYLGATRHKIPLRATADHPKPPSISVILITRPRSPGAYIHAAQIPAAMMVD